MKPRPRSSICRSIQPRDRGTTLALIGALALSSLAACRANAGSAIADKTRDAHTFPGLFTVHWAQDEGALWLEVDTWDQEFLYINSLAAGVGSNDIGLDRAKPGRTRVVRFVRRGPRALLIESNTRYRAVSDNASEVRSVDDAFARSVLAGFDIIAEHDGSALIDLSPLMYADVFDVAGDLARTKQGTYTLDSQRSAVHLPGCGSFPDNTELEVLLTFQGTPAGAHIRSVTPDPRAVSVRQHHSFVRLPDDQYRPRAFDPRAGFWPTIYQDYATPIGTPLTQRVIRRHRLIKRDPEAAISEPVEPLVYYIDRGIPEPIRSALIDGALWWNEAFEAAGFKNALRVAPLPEEANPMDIRYNTIQWVHRSTRGWSYGYGVIDPRTGEIIKGHVMLGSLRVRQDYLIASGLLRPYETGTPASPEMETLALARLRQLSAHEVGHTLGLLHNFAASTDARASVMDYPHPLITLSENDGSIDMSSAYTEGIGAWDRHAIRYGYTPFPDDVDESAALQALLADTTLRFISDEDARPPWKAHPDANLWDNGNDAVAELQRIMTVRQHALDNFGVHNIPEGAPMATLEEALVPLYFAHRYQIQAAATSIGGLRYEYNVRGDGRRGPTMVAGSAQRAALEALIGALDSEALSLSERILSLIPPRPPGYQRSRETMPLRTGITLDPIAAAESLADLIVSQILDPKRASRVVEYHARNAELPSLTEILNRLVDASWKRTPSHPYHDEIARAVSRRVLYHTMRMAADEHVSGQVHAVAWHALDQLSIWLEQYESRLTTDQVSEKAHVRFHQNALKRFLAHPKTISIAKALNMPAGSPIGANQFSHCGR